MSSLFSHFGLCGRCVSNKVLNTPKWSEVVNWDNTDKKILCTLYTNAINDKTQSFANVCNFADWHDCSTRHRFSVGANVLYVTFAMRIKFSSLLG